jgi:interferon gamma-inducible protein 30
MKFSTLFVILVVCSTLIICKDNKIKISVYYETLCPDSTNFINGQLSNAFIKANSLIDIKFIPFGKASVNITQSLAYFHVEILNIIFR